MRDARRRLRVEGGSRVTPCIVAPVRGWGTSPISPALAAGHASRGARMQQHERHRILFILNEQDVYVPLTIDNCRAIGPLETRAKRAIPNTPSHAIRVSACFLSRPSIRLSRVCKSERFPILLERKQIGE